jgi:glycosyltransferase involved in cell wall biosynthesis
LIKLINLKYLQTHKFKTKLRLCENCKIIQEGGIRTKGYFKAGGLIKPEQIDCNRSDIVNCSPDVINNEFDEISENPLFTIITVVYNGEKFLEEAILSVIKQNYDNIEYIIVDGGSTDKTLDIIKKYDQFIDYWISGKDQGIYDAMNRGIKLAIGEYIGFVNADDFIYPDTISNIAKKAKEFHFDYTLGPIHICNSEGYVKETALVLKNFMMNNLYLSHMPAHHLSFYIRNDYLKTIGLFDLNFKIRSDYEMMIRAIENSKLHYTFDCIMGAFREGGISGSYETFFEGYKIMAKYNVSILIRLKTTFRSLLIVFITKNAPQILVKWLRRLFSSGHYQLK